MKKHLGVVNVCGIEYEVEERSVEDDPQLTDCYAYVVHIRSMIVVRRGLSPTCFRNALMHEIQHGIWEHSGIRELDAANSKYEEAFIQIFTPHWITALSSMKKWKVK